MLTLNEIPAVAAKSVLQIYVYYLAFPSLNRAIVPRSASSALA